MKPELLKSWSLEIDYSRTPCLGTNRNTCQVGSESEIGLQKYSKKSANLCKLMGYCPDVLANNYMIVSHIPDFFRKTLSKKVQLM